MGLIRRIFGNSREKDGGTASAPGTLFHESETTEEADDGPRSAPRRELVQVILRDTMRQHGIPSDWIECRIMSTVSREGRNGMHVSFVVRQAHEKLMAYVFAFQESFLRELQRYEPQSKDWLFSVGWQFEGQAPANQKPAMPDPQSWTGQSPVAAAALPLAGKLAGTDHSGFAPTQDPATLDDKSDEDIESDLQALFAIRDAAMAGPARQPEVEDQPDFEATRPFDIPPG